MSKVREARMRMAAGVIQAMLQEGVQLKGESTRVQPGLGRAYDSFQQVRKVGDDMDELAATQLLRVFRDMGGDYVDNKEYAKQRFERFRRTQEAAEFLWGHDCVSGLSNEVVGQVLKGRAGRGEDCSRAWERLVDKQYAWWCRYFEAVLVETASPSSASPTHLAYLCFVGWEKIVRIWGDKQGELEQAEGRTELDPGVQGRFKGHDAVSISGGICGNHTYSNCKNAVVVGDAAGGEMGGREGAFTGRAAPGVAGGS
jgi:hypothetical protein